MDVRNIGLKLVLPILATISPLKMAKVDFRSGIRSEVISVHRGSPSFAAWEDANETIQPLIISALVKPELLRSGKELKSWLRISEKQLAVTTHTKRQITEIDESQIFTFQNIAKNLVQAELDNKNSAHSNIRKIETIRGSEIIVAKGGLPTKPIERSPAEKPKALSETRSLQVSYVPPIEIAPKQKSEVSAASTRSLIANIPRELGQNRHLIAGNFDFEKGAALLGSGDRVFASYQRDGRIVNEGLVDLTNGTYQVETDGLDGVVVAEIRSAAGEILGRGQVGLLDNSAALLAKSPPTKGIDIKIAPVANSFVGKIVSATQAGSIPLKTARIFVEGIDRAVNYNSASKDWRDSTIASASQYMFRAEEPNHRASVSWGEAGRPTITRLYPDTYVRALLELALGKYQARENQNAPVLWGRVLLSGYPVEGAKVSLVGEENKAVYFSGFLPDTNKTKTSKSGEFAFVGLDRGEKIIKAEIPGLNIWPTMLPSYDRTITLADLEISQLRLVEFKSYDAFTLEPQPAVFSPIGLDEERTVGMNGAEAYKIQTVRGLTFVEATSGAEYLPIRMLMKQEQYELHMPQIKTEWLKKIAATKNISEEKLKNAIVGFVEGDDFEVVFGSGGTHVDNQIVYFDVSGQPVKELGPAGGGFVIFDAPTGIQTVTLLPSRGKTVLTQTVYVDALATQVLRTQLTL